VAGENAVKRAEEFKGWNESAIDAQVKAVEERIAKLMNQEGDENWANIRTEMGHTMEAGCGIYRQEDLMQETINKITELKERYKR
ncbi:succinate dehydrogenase/fumarate reductase flavoprotein subunit, partial [Vibrio parahaemolyticus]|nr:succinate dehydrogenase/fumarate reductase flavoprotein subunit [Vibrio parahaemolyticus]